jgi:Cof subfamily protein (haloacid dehalogenase superfamily)
MESVLTAPVMVVSDMDGTLLDHTSRVSERNAAALRRASAAGARVVIATGRPIWWLEPVISVGFDGIAVCTNGAVVYDIGAKEVLASTVLGVEIMQRFVSELELLSGNFRLAVERIGNASAACWAEPEYVHPWDEDVFAQAERAELLSAPAVKLLVRSGHDSADLAQHARQASGGLVAVTYSTDDGLIEIAAPGVNKGAALAKLAAEWGVDPNGVIAFGDMPNDLEMLTWAGHGVAMGNGHADVHAVADEVVGPHHEDAVAQVLERWF